MLFTVCKIGGQAFHILDLNYPRFSQKIISSSHKVDLMGRETNNRISNKKAVDRSVH